MDPRAFFLARAGGGRNSLMAITATGKFTEESKIGTRDLQGPQLVLLPAELRKALVFEVSVGFLVLF